LKKKTNFGESGKYFEESSNESIQANNYIHNNYERFDSNNYLLKNSMKDTELKSNNQNSSSMRYNSVFN